MFSDTLLQLERAHLARLLAWGALSVLLGTALLAARLASRRGSPLLHHFALQTAAWGAIDVVLGALAWRGLHLRDLGGALSLDRTLWLNIGLDAGYVAVGVTLAVVGWRLTRSLALVGAGIGVVMQGLGLAVLDLVFVRGIERWM